MLSTHEKKLQNNEQVAKMFLGTWPIISLSLMTDTAIGLNAFPTSCKQGNTCPQPDFHISLYTWYSQINKSQVKQTRTSIFWGKCLDHRCRPSKIYTHEKILVWLSMKILTFKIKYPNGSLLQT